MRRAVAIVVVLSALVVLGPAGSAEACSCALPDPAEMLGESDAAFVGTLLEKPTESLPGDGSVGVWVFEVETWVKGDLGPEVGVYAALDGAACGFEMEEGQKAGIFLHNRDGRPAGGLCSTTTAEALLAAARPLVFDGNGPAVFVVAAPSGRARLATLDASGRLLDAIEGQGSVWSVSACPGGERLVDVTGTDVVVRGIPGLDAEERIPGGDDHISDIWCLDEEAGRILAHFRHADGETGRLGMLRDDEPLVTGDYRQVIVGSGNAALHLSTGEVELLATGNGETRRLRVPGEVSTLAFSPDDDRLLVATARHLSGGGYEARAHVYDPATGEPLWESEPLADTSLTGWYDADRLIGEVHPLEAGEPDEFLVTVGTGERSDVEVHGMEFFPVEEGVVSIAEGVMHLTPEEGPAGEIATLPSPNHRLVAVLDTEAGIEMATTTTTTPTSPPSTTPTSDPEVGAAPEGEPPGGRLPYLVAAGMAATLLTGAALARRWRTKN